MGLMVDTNVLIDSERAGVTIDFALQPLEQLHINTVIASELLTGVFRAVSEERRDQRLAFVESVFNSAIVYAFTLEIARLHAELQAYLKKKGTPIGAHDLIIAATALYYGHSLLTDNVRDFSRVPNLHVIPFVS